MKAFLLANQLYYPELESGSILFKTARIRASTVDYNPQRFRPAYHKEGMNLRSMGTGKEHYPVSESELSAIGLRKPEEANSKTHYQAIEAIRNSTNTREEFLSKPPKKYSRFHIFHGPSLQMTSTGSSANDRKYINGIFNHLPPHDDPPNHLYEIEFTRGGSYDKPEQHGTPYREVAQMGRAFHEFKNSPAGKVFMVAFPYMEDGLGDVRAKHYIANGFTPIKYTDWLYLDNREKADPSQEPEKKRKHRSFVLTKSAVVLLKDSTMKAFLLANQLYYPELESGSILFKTARIRASTVDYNPQRFRPAYHKEGMKSSRTGKEHYPVSESELSAIGLRKPEEANDVSHYRGIDKIRNKFNTREEFLSNQLQDSAYIFHGPNLVMSSAKRMITGFPESRLSTSLKDHPHLQPPTHVHEIEFLRHEEYNKPENAATPYRELGYMARAFHEFKNSPAGKVVMVAYPHNHDGLGEMRRKHYINNGFSPIPNSDWLALDNRDPELEQQWQKEELEQKRRKEEQKKQEAAKAAREAQQNELTRMNARRIRSNAIHRGQEGMRYINQILPDLNDRDKSVLADFYSLDKDPRMSRNLVHEAHQELKRLRSEHGSSAGTALHNRHYFNIDPSHPIWQRAEMRMRNPALSKAAYQLHGIQLVKTIKDLPLAGEPGSRAVWQR